MRIGRIVRVLEDNKRRETLIDSNQNRKILISFYYPVDPKWKTEKKPKYIDLFYPREDKFISKFRNVVSSDNNYEKDYHLKNIKTNIYNNAPISPRLITYPVVIQSTGLGCPRDYMTFNIEKLVSEGYVVFTVEHTYDSLLTVLPSGRIIEPAKKEFTQKEKEDLIRIRTEDLSFVLNELHRLNEEDYSIKEKLKLDKIGLIGHSLGGAAALRLTQLDNRIKATILFDASLQFTNFEEELSRRESLNTPVLNFRRGSFDYISSMQIFLDYARNAYEGDDFKKQTLIYDKILRDSERNQNDLAKYLSGDSYFIKLKGAKHLTFTDYPILSNTPTQEEGLSWTEAHNQINKVSIAFLDKILKEDSSSYREALEENDSICEF